MDKLLFFRFLAVFGMAFAFTFVGCGDDEGPVDPGGIVDPDDISGPNILQGKITTDLTLTADRRTSLARCCLRGGWRHPYNRTGHHRIW